jgi:REP element-mobilizing transposase RayT
MRQIVQNLLLVLIPPDSDPTGAGFSDLNADGQLSKPFYLPDLVVKMEEVIKNSGLEDLDRAKTGPLPAKKTAAKKAASSGLSAPPDWLQDVSVAAQHLARLSIETSSQASLITKGSQIWAYAGELPQPAAEELAHSVASYFTADGGSDLARFIGLEATGNEYMVYATGLGGEYILAMVFDAEMPFSKIRSQASRMAGALSSQNPETYKPETTPPPPTHPPGAPPETAAEQPIQSLLDDVPPPIPTDWIPESMVPDQRRGFLDELLDEDVAPTPIQPQPTPQMQGGTETQQVDVALEFPEIEADMTQVSKGAETPDYLAETMVSKTARPAPLDETMVSKSTARAGKKVKLEPVSPSVYNLTYACVLIPRFTHHHLTGDTASRLSDWISHMCVAFGWRLEHLSIRPEYILWLVNVPPSTSPGYLMRTIRQHTSRRMFVEFPMLEEDNPSGDFWAPGYLIMSGTQPPPPQLVKDFIRNTRNRQGLKK